MGWQLVLNPGLVSGSFAAHCRPPSFTRVTCHPFKSFYFFALDSSTCQIGSGIMIGRHFRLKIFLYKYEIFTSLP